MCLFKAKLMNIKYNFEFSSSVTCNNHILRIQQPHVTSGYHLGQPRYRTLPPPQKGLLESAGLSDWLNEEKARWEPGLLSNSQLGTLLAL